MSSQIEICNQALDSIGNTPIMAITEDNTRAQACARHYAAALREVQESTPWNFLKRRGALAQVSPAPTFGWDYAYGLPPGLLRVLKVNGDVYTGEPSDWWEIMNGQLLTDADAVNLIYTQYSEDASKFGAQFSTAVATLLASRIASALRQDGVEVMGAMLNIYRQDALPKARRFDGSQGKTRLYNTATESRWVNSHW